MRSFECVNLKLALSTSKFGADETEDVIDAEVYDPSKHKSEGTIPCFDPSTMKYLGTMPAMTAKEVTWRTIGFVLLVLCILVEKIIVEADICIQ